MKKPLFVLASKSPRRKELLKNIGIDAEIMPSNIDESALSSLPPEKMVTELAMLKATDVARSFRGDVYVIGADTCVCIEGEIMGKPQSEDHAREMLAKLSGRTHSVFTGYCVVNCKSGEVIAKCEKTDVTFRDIDDEEIEAYIKTKEPFDKAGAYGIQKMGAIFVKKIDGDFFNVVGLPVCALVQLMKKEFRTDVF